MFASAPQFVESESLAPVALSDDVIAQMNEDLLDVRRNELDDLTDDDFEAMRAALAAADDVPATPAEADLQFALAYLSESFPAGVSFDLAERRACGRRADGSWDRRSEWTAVACVDPTRSTEPDAYIATGSHPTPAEAATAIERLYRQRHAAPAAAAVA